MHAQGYQQWQQPSSLRNIIHPVRLNTLRIPQLRIKPIHRQRTYRSWIDLLMNNLIVILWCCSAG